MKGFVTLLAAMMTCASSSLALAMNSYFDTTAEPKGASLVFSECKAEEVDECVSYSLWCDVNSFPLIQLTIIDRNVEKIAAAIIVGTQGHAPGTLKLGAKSPPVAFDISSLEMNANELDGGWSLQLGLGGEDLYNAVTDANSQGASLFLAGETFTLAPGNAGGSNLKQFMSACAAIKG